MKNCTSDRIDALSCRWAAMEGQCLLTGECRFEVTVESMRPIAIANLVERARDRQVGGDHYKNMGVEPWDVVDTWPLEQRIGYYRGGALKYLMRMGAKDESAQEVAKGKHYIEKLLEVLEKAPPALPD